MTHPSLQLFNTLSLSLETFQPMEAGKVRMYVCGPTVYDDAHLGHARCYITWDVLYRFLKFLGYDVTYARNVTDVDDKILNRAKDLGISPKEVAEKNYVSFLEDMAALNTLRPDKEPKATEYIAEMHTGIRVMIEKGMAYATSDGSVYYRVSRKSDYGKLSKKPLDDLEAGARVEVDPMKESPMDFALWKGVSKDDPNGWESDWGWGRPGWHLECSAMNHGIFGDQIDIHAGGADLIFPHHENEIAQTEAWTEKTPFSRYWLHNGFVNVSGEKMSKSLGNFSTIKKVLERYDANTIRYFLLTNKYRMPVDFNEEALEGAKNRIRKIKKHVFSASVPTAETAEMKTYLEKFRTVMSDDLNTPQALAIANEALEENVSSFLYLMSLLGFDVNTLVTQEALALPNEAIQTIYKEITGKWLEHETEPSVLLDELIVFRKTAKESKNFQQADAIRKHLSDIGISLMDRKDGTTEWEYVGD